MAPKEALRKDGVRQPTVPKRFREPEGNQGNRRRRPAGTRAKKKYIKQIRI